MPVFFDSNLISYTESSRLIKIKTSSFLTRKTK